MGFVAGLMTLALPLLGRTGIQHWGVLGPILAALLLADSALTVVGPKALFYPMALISALLGADEWAGSGPGAAPGEYMLLAALGVTVVLAIYAARFEPAVSEESHPMNLPVFG